MNPLSFAGVILVSFPLPWKSQKHALACGDLAKATQPLIEPKTTIPVQLADFVLGTLITGATHGEER
jgi:hypothetical protein